jgi:hypothetical protein
VSRFAARRAGRWLRGLTIGLAEDGLEGLEDEIRVEWESEEGLCQKSIYTLGSRSCSRWGCRGSSKRMKRGALNTAALRSDC